MNDRPAKSASEVKPGDLVHLELGSRAITVRVRLVPQSNIPAQEADSLYEKIEEIRRPPEVLEWLPDEI